MPCLHVHDQLSVHLRLLCVFSPPQTAAAGYTVAKALESSNVPADVQQSCAYVEQAVHTDPYLSMYLVGSVQHVKLDVQRLLQDAAAAAADGGGGRVSLQLDSEPAAAASSSHNGSREVVDWPVSPGGCSSASGTAEDAAACARGAATDGVLTAAGTSNSASAAAASAAGPSKQQVSAAALLQYVCSRVWHGRNQQMDFCRRSLAIHLVQQANPGDGSTPANSKPKAYVLNFANAGLSPDSHQHHHQATSKRSPGQQLCSPGLAF